MLAMQCGVLGWRHSPAAAVRPDLVVVLAPGGNGRPGLGEGFEPMLIQALVTELAVEALDVAVLHGLAWLDQQVLDAVSLCPAHERPACEFRPVVCAHGLRIAPEQGGLVEQASHILAGDAEVGGNVDALMTEIVGHRQAFEAPATDQAVADEIHAPYLIDGFGDLQRYPLSRRSLRLLAFLDRKLRGAVQAKDALVIHAGVLRAQQVVNAPIAEAAPRLGDIDDRRAQRSILGIGGRWIPVAVSG